MRRREVIALFGASVAWPFAAIAQQPGRTYRLGGLSTSPRNSAVIVAMLDELRRFGFIEGQNLTIYWHEYRLRVDLVSEFAVDLVKAKVDVIYAVGDVAIRAAQRATMTTPILGATEDMVASGLVNSLAQPGGNTTGLSILAAELDGKRQEILIEALPGIRRMAALADTTTTAASRLQGLKDAARGRGVELSIHQVAGPDEIPEAIDAAKASGAAALNILSAPLLYGSRQTIIQRLAALRLPAIYQFPEEAEEGGLIGYGPRVIQMYREIMPRQLAQLLRGARPADIPVEQPTKFDLVINLKTAKAMGMTVPEALLARADKVIE